MIKHPVVAICLVCLLSIVGGATAADESTLEIRASDTTLFVLRSTGDSESKKPHVYFAFADVKTPKLRFRPITTDPVPDSLAALVARSKNLHLFFSDGGHYRISAPRDPSLGWQEAPERMLPQRITPVAVASEQDGEAIVAIVPARIGLLLNAPATQPAESNGKEEDEDQSDGATIGPVPEPEGYWLVRYADGKWQAVDRIPDYFDQPRLAHLACDKNTYHLFFSRTDSPEVLRHAVRVDDTWHDAVTIPEDDAQQFRAAMVDNETVTLVMARKQDAEREQHYIRQATAGGWSPQRKLTIDGMAARFPVGDTAVDTGDNRIAIVWLNEKDEPVVAVWPDDGGDPVKGPVTVLALVRPGGATDDEAGQLIATAVIIVLVTIVFIARRESFLVDAQLPPGFVLAPLARRLIAFLVDLVLVLLIVYPTLFLPFFSDQIDLTRATFEEQMIVARLNPQEIFWRWIAAAGVFIVYAGVFELITAATPGKRLMRLQVADHRGQRCSFKAIATRNLLRIIELYPNLLFAPTLVFVVLTRNYQRIGDLMARTVVITRQANQPEPNEQIESPADDDDADQKPGE